MKTYESVEDIFRMIERMEARLTERVENLSQEQANFRPAPDAWSIVEVIEHLALAETGTIRLFEKMLAREDVSKGRRPSIEKFRESAAAFKEKSTRSTGAKLDAPKHIRPTGEKSLAEALQAFRAGRERLRALRPQIENANLFAATYPHPVFGELDLAQWLAFISLHEAHHLPQIERNTSHPDFPQSAVA